MKSMRQEVLKDENLEELVREGLPMLRDALRLDLILKDLQKLTKMARKTGQYDQESSEEIILDN